MAVAEIRLADETTRWSHHRGAVIAVLGSVGAGLIWFLAKVFLGQSALLGGYVAALAVLIGVGAGYGALYGSDRRRGTPLQIIAVAVTLVSLVVFQDLVMQVHVVRLEQALAEQGLQFAQEITFADRFSEGFFGTNFVDLSKVAEESGGATAVPGLIFWVIALVYAIAIPRKYDKYGPT
ncbi:MAG: hypothetical protein HKN80_01960 [Acidimicrobiia bacterium]|nr:hypothetical protein [Acidimicrobiia bacterium]NNC91235.1 hypothetical protein [Acidimicrobiia bacterium]